MDTLSYKTVSVGKTAAQKEWVIVDATDQVLGRLASKVAKILRGKYKPCFTPNADCGDNVIIINADKVKLTGNKWSDKIYLTYIWYLHMGGFCMTTKKTFKIKGFQIINKSKRNNSVGIGNYPLLLQNVTENLTCEIGLKK